MGAMKRMVDGKCVGPADADEAAYYRNWFAADGAALIAQCKNDLKAEQAVIDESDKRATDAKAAADGADAKIEEARIGEAKAGNDVELGKWVNQRQHWMKK